LIILLKLKDFHTISTAIITFIIYTIILIHNAMIQNELSIINKVYLFVIKRNINTNNLKYIIHIELGNNTDCNHLQCTDMVH